MSLRIDLHAPALTIGDGLRPLGSVEAVLFSGLFDQAAAIDATKRRKVDGALADTRLGKQVTARWSNERFRQTMMLVLEFRLHHDILSPDDVEFIRVAVDVALAEAEKASHVGDIYDMNPTTWACWLVQHAYATRTGGWAVTSMQEQIDLSFAGLYTFLQHQHALGLDRHLRDPLTSRVIRRYKLPVKKMNVPPKRGELFKWKRGAQRLSDWMVAGGLPPLHPGIIAQEPPTIVTALPPGAEQAAAQRDRLWRQIATRAREQEELVSALGDGSDDAETREIVASLMFESRGSREAGGGRASGEARPSQPAAARQTEDGGGGASGDAPGPSETREAEDERIPVIAELVGPPSLEEDNRSVSQLLADLQRFADAL